MAEDKNATLAGVTREQFKFVEIVEAAQKEVKPGYDPTGTLVPFTPEENKEVQRQVLTALTELKKSDTKLDVNALMFEYERKYPAPATAPKSQKPKTKTQNDEPDPHATLVKGMVTPAKLKFFAIQEKAQEAVRPEQKDQGTYVPFTPEQAKKVQTMVLSQVAKDPALMAEYKQHYKPPTRPGPRAKQGLAGVHPDPGGQHPVNTNDIKR